MFFLFSLTFRPLIERAQAPRQSPGTAPRRPSRCSRRGLPYALPRASRYARRRHPATRHGYTTPPRTTVAPVAPARRRPRARRHPSARRHRRLDAHERATHGHRHADERPPAHGHAAPPQCTAVLSRHQARTRGVKWCEHAGAADGGAERSEWRPAACASARDCGRQSGHRGRQATAAEEAAGGASHRGYSPVFY
jgi:hypothetical protein